jgi:uncharacterized protein YcfL
MRPLPPLESSSESTTVLVVLQDDIAEPINIILKDYWYALRGIESNRRYSLATIPRDNPEQQRNRPDRGKR